MPSTSTTVVTRSSKAMIRRSARNVVHQELPAKTRRTGKKTTVVRRAAAKRDKRNIGAANVVAVADLDDVVVANVDAVVVDAPAVQLDDAEAHEVEMEERIPVNVDAMDANHAVDLEKEEELVEDVDMEMEEIKDQYAGQGPSTSSAAEEEREPSSSELDSQEAGPSSSSAVQQDTAPSSLQIDDQEAGPSTSVSSQDGMPSTSQSLDEPSARDFKKGGRFYVKNTLWITAPSLLKKVAEEKVKEAKKAEQLKKLKKSSRCQYENLPCPNHYQKKECPKGSHCNNRPISTGKFPKLQCYKINDTIGYGVKTTKKISKTDFVVEYVGEVIEKEEFNKRMEKNEKEGKTRFYGYHAGNYCIYSDVRGNMARFVNHSCDPNLGVEQWEVEGRGGLKAIVFRALRDIMPGEELFINYNADHTGKSYHRCFCGKAVCTGSLGKGPAGQNQPKPPAPEIKDEEEDFSGQENQEVDEAAVEAEFQKLLERVAEQGTSDAASILRAAKKQCRQEKNPETKKILMAVVAKARSILGGQRERRPMMRK